MNNLKGKVIIVTGASKGIGKQIAKDLAYNGASVVVNYNSDEKGAKEVVNEIEQNGGIAIALKANVSKSKEVKELFEQSNKLFGGINAIVNNAGVYKFEPVEMITEEEFHHQFNTNVLSVLLTIQEALNYFSKGGSIINISSVANVKATPMTSLYTATKSAVDALTRTLSKELGTKDIRINSILPGPIKTEGNPIDSDVQTYIATNTPLGRLGETTDVAKLASFLASDEASFITGQKISVSGGFD